MTTAIWWIRRDLRLHDNPALMQAISTSESTIPLFIFDPALLTSQSVAEQRTAFLLAGLRELASSIAGLGGRMIFRTGHPKEVLQQLTQETRATAIYAAQDASRYARTRDAVIKAELPLVLLPGTSIRPIGSTLKKDGKPYTVFTPYRRAWLSDWDLKPPLPPPTQIRTPAGISGGVIPENPAYLNPGEFLAGEGAALARLDAFASLAQGPILRYADLRDCMDEDGTSRLSPYLRFGMLSPRTAASAAHKAMHPALTASGGSSAETWLSELIWREFYLDILHHFPHVQRSSFRPAYEGIRWRNDEREFLAWKQGLTGYPVVDAGMRQLAQTGWMHNRARMITSSFLVKDLLVDWRWGERWFMQNLLDGDPASNNGGWQWVAGTGTDAAPYFRIFNPVTQGKRFDPQGTYIKRWLPELQPLEPGEIHEPWRLSSARQASTGVHIGRDYPEPIVDHALARERTLASYQAARDRWKEAN